ncbi:Gfo/Idh/MocA family protein [Anaerophaga thermohalophila]|jgi:predicted dehydrogenase|uniref:Gfo/Idh/MocA family protein n=1 Tax=Anaerophaga thermohalophila TaxID=177400 RepID=UPI0002E4150D|nr:Gfo/Idh/MocA family oxidoreductase [Anaerophaga thermohalophila]
MHTELIRFGIIGCGRIANRHAKHIANNGQLAATCDIDIEKAGNLADEYGCKAWSDTEKFLTENKGKMDVVSVCSPNGLHADHTIAALRHGYHVLCEKPMAISVEDCGNMINEAERANRRLFIVKQNRFNPPVEALKKAIEENRLGKIFNVQLSCFWNRNENYYKESNWKGSKEMDGGTLFTQFSHFIDLLYWLIGDVKSVRSFTRNFTHQNIIDFEDTGVVAMEFYNGAIGTINYTVNSYQQNMEGSITVFGEKGTVKIGGQYLNKLEYQNIKDFRIENLAESSQPNDYGNYQGSMSNHDKVYENLVSVLTRQGVIATNGFEGLKTVEIIDKIYSKAK